MAVAVRKLLAECWVGSPDAILELGGREGLSDDLVCDDRFEAALDVLTLPRRLRMPFASAPVISKSGIVALVVTADGGSFALLIVSLVLGFHGWVCAIEETDYAGVGFSSRELRGTIAARIGGGARPDQIALHFVGITEKQISAQRRLAAESLFIQEIGWSRSHAERVFKKLGIGSPGDSPAAN